MDREPGPSRGVRIGPPHVTRVGVAGWSYPDWEGIVYPKGRRTDGLSFLSRFFDAIEVNSSFYRTPTPSTTSSWARRARENENENLRLTLKLYKGFTHDRNATEDEASAVRTALTPLQEAGILGALLLQFPWSFKNDESTRAYLADLLERFGDYPLVVEVRHASWNRLDFFAELTERGVGFVNVDQPLIGRSLGPSERATGPVGYVRLHGRNYRDWFRENAGRDARYDYLYTERELDPWIEKISEVAESAAETYVVTNNHFRGQAVVNALQIRYRLEGRKVEAPASLVEHYPVLESIVAPDAPSQGRLF